MTKLSYFRQLIDADNYLIEKGSREGSSDV